MRKIIIAALLFTASPAFATQSVTVGFSPSYTALKNILDVISEATVSLDVEAYSFTSKPIATAIVAAQKRGVRVRVIADEKANSGNYSAVTFLTNQHVPVRLNGRYAIMHNKVMIVDSKTVQTGSFNYTASANTRNAENSLVLRDFPKVAVQYEEEFNRLWAESEALTPSY